MKQIEFKPNNSNVGGGVYSPSTIHLSSNGGNKPPITVNKAKKAATMEDIVAQKAALQQQKAAIEAAEEQLVEQEKQKVEQLKKEKLLKIDQALEDAKKYEEWAKNESTKLEKDREVEPSYYLQLSREARTEAYRLQGEIGVAMQEIEDTSETLTFWEKHHNKAWVFSILLLVGSLFFCYSKIMEYKEVIQMSNAKNAASDNLTQMLGNPYDESSIQKIYYDNLVQFSDVPKFFIFLLILTPFILFYLLPFIKTKKDIWTEFFELEAYQRHWLTFAWSALLLLVFTFYHLGSK